MVTKETIIRELGALGLPSAATVLLHSSLSSLGWVDRGVETVVDAFLDHLGPAGTLVVPTLPFRGSQYDYLQADPLFDPDTTPSLMGRITESVLLRPGAQRSWHPSHSVSAIGPAATIRIDLKDGAPVRWRRSKDGLFCWRVIPILLAGRVLSRRKAERGA